MAGLRDLPLDTCERHIRAFGRFGWKETRRTGGHAILEKRGHPATLSIPCSSRPVKRKLLKALLDLAGISIDDYRKKFR